MMMPEVVQNHILLKKIWKKPHRKNDNYMAAIVGPTGCGKSWASLRLGEILDPDFNVDQVAFNSSQFLNLVDEKKTDIGSVINFDEAGVGQASRKWYSNANIFFNYVLQTWRNKNRIAIFTVPSLGLIDYQTRGLLDAVMIFNGKDHSREAWTEFKYQRISANEKSGKIYYKYPVLRNNGRKEKIKTFRISKPSEELIEPYEEKKSKFQEELEEEVRKQVQEKEEEKTISEIISEVRDNLERYKKMYHGKEIINKNLVMADFEVGSGKARKIKAVIEADWGD